MEYLIIPGAVIIIEGILFFVRKNKTKELPKQIQKLEKEKKQLLNEEKVLKEDLQEANRKIEELEAEIKDLSDVYDESVNKVRELEAEIKERAELAAKLNEKFSDEEPVESEPVTPEKPEDSVPQPEEVASEKPDVIDFPIEEDTKN